MATSRSRRVNQLHVRQSLGRREARLLLCWTIWQHCSKGPDCFHALQGNLEVSLEDLLTLLNQLLLSQRAGVNLGTVKAFDESLVSVTGMTTGFWSGFLRVYG